MNKTDVNISIINWLKNQNEFSWKYMPQKHVYRVKKVGRLVDAFGKPQDGWMIFNLIKMNIIPRFVKGVIDQNKEKFDECFGSCFHVYGNYVEIDG